MSTLDMTEKIRGYLRSSNWLDKVTNVEFLAAGEYNENYLTETRNSKYVFRINHGSQLGLLNQIEYEYNALKAVENSKVTPKALEYDLIPPEFEGGVLLMEYLPGKILNYRDNWKDAARIFAKIHELPICSDLIIQTNPIDDIASESLGMIERFPKHPLKYDKEKLLKYHEKITTLGTKILPQFKDDHLCIVNTEVNSGNFLIESDSGYLVDWEKAVVSYRYQDLGHFLVQTTTRWKSDYVYTKQEKKLFLKYYLEQLSEDINFETVLLLTESLEKTIRLRALSWCYMAYYEYNSDNRSLKNEYTFNKIKEYLDQIDNLLA